MKKVGVHPKASKVDQIVTILTGKCSFSCHVFKNLGSFANWLIYNVCLILSLEMFIGRLCMPEVIELWRGRFIWKELHLTFFVSFWARAYAYFGVSSDHSYFDELLVDTWWFLLFLILSSNADDFSRISCLSYLCIYLQE